MDRVKSAAERKENCQLLDFADSLDHGRFGMDLIPLVGLRCPGCWGEEAAARGTNRCFFIILIVLPKPDTMFLLTAYNYNCHKIMFVKKS